ncbi:MAG: alpha-E domain-containing protein [Paludibacteraceae bacterium]|jgi:uncharacterized alpha-E superfamily protein|nr:alpha-E domain-containing protein [Paludibacteraceae bacterium]
MVKSDIISVMKANRLFWLGRYEERVYLTLLLLNKCFDKMIDGQPDDYRHFWLKLDPLANYSTTSDFTYGMMFDASNPNSVISALVKAKDNAILLREDISSDTLSFIEMSIAHINECSSKGVTNISKLQPILDWSLAFWGAADQHVFNPKEFDMMQVGKDVENIDILLRFSFPYERVTAVYESLKRTGAPVAYLMFDEVVEQRLDGAFSNLPGSLANDALSSSLLADINKLVKV